VSLRRSAAAFELEHKLSLEGGGLPKAENGF